ncbi:MAG: PilZ domain-containing protein [Candidatus Eremiobacterota bacterium]
MTVFWHGHGPGERAVMTRLVNSLAGPGSLWERRGETRQPCRRQVWVLSRGRSQNARVLDSSPGGFHLRTRQPLEAGDPVFVGSFYGICRWSRLSPGGWECGVQVALRSPGRRRARRFQVHVPVELFCGSRRVAGVTADLGMDGAQVSLNSPLVPGSTLRLAASPRHGCPRLFLLCRVLDCRERRPGQDFVCRLRFAGRSLAQLHTLSDYLTRQAARVDA